MKKLQKFVSLALALFAINLLVENVQTFHVPGVSVHSYKRYEPIKIYAKDIEYNNGLQAYEFFDYFCGVDSTINNQEIADNFLDKYFNDVAHVTPFRAIMSLNQECKAACVYNLKMNPKDLVGTRVRFYVENLTVMGHMGDNENHQNDIRVGVPLVHNHGRSPVQHNHFKFILYVNNLDKMESELSNNVQTRDNHPKKKEQFRHKFISNQITRVEVEPYSIAEDLTFNENEGLSYKKGCRKVGDDLTKAKPLYLDEMDPNENQIFITYSVEFRNSAKTTISTKWDNEPATFQKGEFSWASIFTSLSICCLLQGLIAYMLSQSYRTRTDDTSNNEDTAALQDTSVNDNKSSTQNLGQSNWKKLKMDVFRPPNFPLIFSVFVGSGIHGIVIICSSTFFAAIFFITEFHRGDVILGFALCYLLTSILNGYVSARVYKLLKGVHWLNLAIFASVFIPSGALIVVLFMNTLLELEGSDLAIDFWHIVFMISIWAGCYIPQIFLGSLIGFSKKEIKVPCNYSLVGRSILNLPGYQDIKVTTVLGGVLPFFTILYQIDTLTQNFWGGGVTVMFPLLMFVLLIMVVTCAQVGICVSFINLVHGNYRWWWASFFAGASTGVYVWIYSSLYFIFIIGPRNFNHFILFSCFSSLISGLISLACGSISFYSSFFFVKKLYSNVKAS